MKVLCPVDFSEVSINAAKWIVQLLNNIGQSELHLTHFVYITRRASMFSSIEELIIGRAEKDLNLLVSELESLAPNVSITNSIFSAHPKEAIVAQGNKGQYDLIVTGSTGLTALKNITMGSVTEFVMNHSKIPIIAIPGNVEYSGLSKIALSVDDEIIERLSSLALIRDICVTTDAMLYLIHITEENESPFEYDPGIDLFFRDLKFKYDRLEMIKSVPITINKYCHKNGIELLSMVHHKRNWIQRIIQKSITKSELFNLELPLLVLPEL